MHSSFPSVPEFRQKKKRLISMVMALGLELGCDGLG